MCVCVCARVCVCVLKMVSDGSFNSRHSVFLWLQNKGFLVASHLTLAAELHTTRTASGANESLTSLVLSGRDLVRISSSVNDSSN